MSEWEDVTIETDRLKVDGGHIYRISRRLDDVSVCFVPDIDLSRYESHMRDAYNKGLEDGIEQCKHTQEALNHEDVTIDRTLPSGLCI